MTWSIVWTILGVWLGINALALVVWIALVHPGWDPSGMHGEDGRRLD